MQHNNYLICEQTYTPLTFTDRLLPRPLSIILTGPCLFSNQDVALVTAVGCSGVYCGPSEYNPPISDVSQWVTTEN